jgi:hypothetical protein
MSLKFEIQPATNPTSKKERTARLVDPGAGRIFTDHMAVVSYNQAKSWHDARVESRANFSLDPAAAVLHYAQEIFEGLKAYKRDDGGVNLFRPDANARRFWNSAEGMAMAHAGDSGRKLHRKFCPRCGSAVFVEAEGFPGMALIMGGTLDDTGWLKPTMPLFCDSAQPWVAIAHQMKSFPRMPG